MQTPNRGTKSGLLRLILAIALSGTACAGMPTHPDEATPGLRRENVGCVGRSDDGQVDTLPALPDGSCELGFDSISWW